ncbi:threonine ammonia-lyase [Pseudothermotoga lettingae]|uniref:threonine ammonia-lyase n=1 Tax=Pseudothermotoga lettingae TaxID=177758 RepID=UPI00074A26A5|nr:threonine/serine dehydratase [Pseudothermotoga lettingae]KUK19940.1 MAG: Pyridoxal-5'-phosphate-dependent protein beta subunit [Pseudothermotoga lettingae]
MITLQDVRDAKRRISQLAHTTPVFSSQTLNILSESSVFLKAENLQKSGSFKFRGAMNFLLSLSRENLRNGVVTGSSGNHGQALACAGKILNTNVTVVVPEDVSAAKLSAIKGYGARIERCGRTSTERLNRAYEISQQTGAIFVPPFDHPWIMAGQGTIGLELIEQLCDFDAVLVPCGGCGLISGISKAIKEILKNARVYGVEPEQSNSTYLSFKAGHLVELKNINTIADGLRTAVPGKLTFPVVQKYVDDILLVSEEEIKKAIVFLLERMKLLVEPSGAVTVAALLSGKFPLKNKKVVAILSGGNVDLFALSKWIKEIKQGG